MRKISIKICKIMTLLIVGLLINSTIATANQLTDNLANMTLTIDVEGVEDVFSLKFYDMKDDTVSLKGFKDKSFLEIQDIPDKLYLKTGISINYTNSKGESTYKKYFEKGTSIKSFVTGLANKKLSLNGDAFQIIPDVDSKNFSITGSFNNKIDTYVSKINLIGNFKFTMNKNFLGIENVKAARNIPNGLYFLLTSNNTDNCLNIYNNTKIEIDKFNQGQNQKFTFIYDENVNAYKILNNNKAVMTWDKDYATGDVVFTADKEESNQYWSVEHAGGNDYYLVNIGNANKVLSNINDTVGAVDRNENSNLKIKFKKTL